MFLPPVADTLLLQFKTLAKARVDAATPLDRGESPYDPVYEKVLNGLNLVAQHAAMPLLDALLAWRKDAESQAQRLGGELVVLRKKLAVEAVFLEASHQLVGPGSSGLSGRQAEALERLAFDWALNAETYVEPKFSDLIRAREKVTCLGADITGAMAKTRLPVITARFLKELEARIRLDASAARQEILQMCEGMKRITLPVSTNADLKASTDFLRQAHPLKHVAPVRKSQVQHALCEVLAAMLADNVKADLPRSVASSLDPALLKAWFHTITTMRTELANWTARQSKHAAVAYPLITYLICMEENNTFSQYVDTLVDNLHRQLKDKLLRTLVLTCLHQAMTSYLARLGPRLTQDKVHRWLAKANKPILLNLRKGNLGFPEQQDLVRQICVTIADHGAADFAVGSLIIELISSDGNWEAIMIGLKALLSIFMTAPARAAGKQASGNQAHGGSQDEVTEAQLLEMIRNGSHPLDAYGIPSEVTKVSLVLAKVLQQCQVFFGSYRTVNTNKPLLELIPKEKVAGLPVFTQALRLVPFAMPEHWSGPRLCEDLPGLTLHADAGIRAQAVAVMKRILRGVPRMRNAMLLGVAGLAARIPDDTPEAIKDALRRLVELMEEWQLILTEKSRGTFHESVSSAAAKLDLARIEGLGMSFLCSNLPDVRKVALDVLFTVRELHGKLLQAGGRSAPVTPVTPAPSITNPPTPGSNSPSWEPDLDHTYMMDVIEEMGFDVSHRCYWDFGRWSDLCRVWRQAGDDLQPEELLNFEAVLSRNGTYEDSVRWARCLSEIVKQAGQLCNESATAAYVEVSSRLQALMYKNSSHQVILPADSLGESSKADLCRTYCMVAAASPLHSSSASRGQGVLSTKDLFKVMLSNVRAAPEPFQQAALLALGFCNCESVPLLLEEMQGLIEEYSSTRTSVSAQALEFMMPQGSRSRLRRDEMRTIVAHIYRLVATDLRPGALQEDATLRSKLTDWIVDTLKYLQSATAESFSEMQQLRYCLCMVSKAVATALGGSPSQAFNTPLRRTLFDTFGTWCEEGSTPARYRAEVGKTLAMSRMRIKDLEMARHYESDMAETADVVEHAAYVAMAAMLLGPSFETPGQQQGGRVLSWIQRMLTAANPTSASASSASVGPAKSLVAQTALLHLLSTNVELFGVCVDQCYASQAPVSRAYFQVVAEVYAAQEVVVKPHILLSLVLYKIVDPAQDVRDDALHLLDVLSSRIWKDIKDTKVASAEAAAALAGQPSDQNPGRVAVVIGNLQDSYQQFQYQLSAKLARDHPELSELLCVEMMTRQQDAVGRAAHHQVLTCLPPWMENLSFAARWEGNWSERLLQSMYYVTAQHGTVFPHEIERLWSTVAGNKRNIIPILDYVISKGQLECGQDLSAVERFFTVAKRIALFLARTSSQHTIDHLVYEISQQISEDGELAPAALSAETGASEFQHVRWPSNHSRHSSGGFSTGEALKGEPRARTPTGGPMRRIEMLKTSSFRSDLSSSSLSPSIADSAMTHQRTSGDNHSPDNSRRNSSMQVASPLGPRPDRGILTRPQLAMCLLAEVAYEHDEDFRSHLPLLFHAIMIAMDSPEPLVYHHAQQALVNLLYSLSARHLELHKNSGALLTEHHQVTSLIKYLQSMRSRRLWAYEDITLRHTYLASSTALAALVNAVTEAIFFESDLRERWAAEALKWMLECNSRHLACRSHQVFRALRPAPSSDACTALLTGLAKCLTNPSRLSLEVAADIILTLQVVVDVMEPGKLVLYPQILLACTALLGMSFVHLWRLLLELLSKVLDKLDLNDGTVQHVVLASIPPQEIVPAEPASPLHRMRVTGEGWLLGAALLQRPHLLALHQLLIKGLFNQDTQLITVQVMTQLADQIASSRPPFRSNKQPQYVTSMSIVGETQGQGGTYKGLAALFGDPKDQLALSIFSLLPWLCLHFQHTPFTPVAQACIKALRSACDKLRLVHVADGLAALSSHAQQDLASLLAMLCPPLCAAFFPRFAKVAFQRMMEVLQRGSATRLPALAILRAIFEVPGLQLGPAAPFANDSQLFFPVAALLESSVPEESKAALQVLDAVMQYSDRGAGEDAEQRGMQVEVLHWAAAIDDTGFERGMVNEALSNTIDSWPGHARKAGRAKLMPFIDTAAEQRGASLELRSKIP
ncbi:hypothetical protein WJX82_006983 [Trebouxia sp. C0006]